MSKLEQILQIEPAHELHFKGPFNEVVSSNINLHNPTDKTVCFKVKTTAPKKYCVRPNSGAVQPQSTVSVAVMLQPHDFDVKEKSKHKFMVQSMVATGNTDNLDNIWKEASQDQIMDSKLKCVFDLAEEQISEIEAAEKTAKDKIALTTNTETSAPSSTPQAQSSIAKTRLQETEHVPIKNADDEKLKAEIRRLKEENVKLREEVKQYAAGETNTAPPSEVLQVLQPAESENQFPPIVYLIVALIFGIIIAKFLL